MQQLNNMKQQQQQQHPTNRGILPPETLNALDLLVDRLNASSGRLPTATTANIGKTSLPPPPLPIRALLVGTNEGVGLSRSLGTMMVMENTTRTDGTAADNSQSNNNNSIISNNMNEDVLGRIETVWATLVSAVPPHIMAAATNASSSNNEVAPTPAHYKQPSHPLLSPLLLGDTVRVVTATYTNCTVVHVHMAPLVITIITLPTANLGAVRNVAIPMLKVILEPVRRIIVRSRWQNNAASAGAGGSGVQQQQQQHMQQQQQQQNVNNGKIILDTNADPLAGLTGGQKIALLSMTPEQKTQFLIQHQQQILLRQQQLHQQQQSQALSFMQQQQQQQMMMLMNQQGQQQGQQQSMMQGGNNNMSYQQYMYPALSDEA
jgi:hypothetical protein